jgi:membrane protease YdiL (CAAX protease family)
MSAKALLQQHRVAAFLAGTVGLGWLVTFLAAQLPAGSALAPLLALPVSFIPAIVAVVLVRVTRPDPERRGLRSRLTTVRVGLRWYVAAIAILPTIHLAGVELAAVAGGSIAVHPALLAVLPLFLLTSLGEELGWRGYALPKLQERMTPLAASLVVGLAWAAFHWVAFLGNHDAPIAYVLVGTAQLMAMSVILTFVFNNARQALPLVVLAHAMYDTISVGVAPLADTGVPLLAFALSSGVAWVVALGIIAVTGPSLRAARRSALVGTPVPG